MAIPDLATYSRRLAVPTQRLSMVKTLVTVANTGRLFSSWMRQAAGTGAPNPSAANPSTAVVPTRSTVGALPLVNGATALRALLAEQLVRPSGPTAFLTILADRLSHQGGLSGTVTTAQTTNLPTAALTRYAGGAGVMAAVEVYGQVGATPVHITASYTNSSGVAGRTAESMDFPYSGGHTVGCFYPLDLQSGDVGVSSVESVTLDGSTGTAGNIGVVLFRPILFFAPISGAGHVVDAMFGLGGQLQEILADACLFVLQMTYTGANPPLFNLYLAED